VLSVPYPRSASSACRVTVTIKNKGFEAFRADLYGESIIVERNVFRDGKVSGGYKIKSGLTGKIVSTKRDDLDAILDHMNIQVDNPINVLSQDAARAFLTKSNAKAKYDVRASRAPRVIGRQRFALADARRLCSAPSSSSRARSSPSCRRSTTSSRRRSTRSRPRSGRRRRSCPR
jgi:hypothetical protein